MPRATDYFQYNFINARTRQLMTPECTSEYATRYHHGQYVTDAHTMPSALFSFHAAPDELSSFFAFDASLIAPPVRRDIISFPATYAPHVYMISITLSRLRECHIAAAADADSDMMPRSVNAVISAGFHG